MVDTVDDRPCRALRAPRLTFVSRFWLFLRSPFRRLTATTDLTDKDLQDIGVPHRDIGGMVDRDMARLRSRDLRGH